MTDPADRATEGAAPSEAGGASRSPARHSPQVLNEWTAADGTRYRVVWAPRPVQVFNLEWIELDLATPRPEGW